MKTKFIYLIFLLVIIKPSAAEEFPGDDSQFYRIDRLEPIDAFIRGFKNYNKDLSEDEVILAILEEMTAKQLRVVRNTIFARHHYKFKTPWLRDYFCINRIGRAHSEKVILSDIEQRNVKLIQSLEKKGLPEWVENGILRNLDSCTAIQCARQFNHEDSDTKVWLISLLRSPMEKRKSVISMESKKYYGFDQQDEVYDTYQGSQWIEAVRVVNERIEFLEIEDIPKIRDTFIFQSNDGLFGLIRTSEAGKDEYEIERNMDTSANTISTIFWPQEHNTVRLVEATCCCLECAKITLYAKLEDKKVILSLSEGVSKRRYLDY